MTYLDATVKAIETNDALNLVYFDVAGSEVVMMSLQMDQKLQEGERVKLGIKPTAIALAKECCKGSFANCLRATVLQIKEGMLLSQVKFQVEKNRCEAIVLTKKLLQMQIQKGDTVFAIFMASELSVQETYDV